MQYFELRSQSVSVSGYINSNATTFPDNGYPDCVALVSSSISATYPFNASGIPNTVPKPVLTKQFAYGETTIGITNQSTFRNFRWYINGQDTGQTSGTFVFTPKSNSDICYLVAQYYYSSNYTEEVRSDVCRGYLIGDNTIVITDSPDNDRIEYQSPSKSYTIQATAMPGLTLRYQWKVNGAVVQNNSNTISSSYFNTPGTYTIECDVSALQDSTVVTTESITPFDVEVYLILLPGEFTIKPDDSYNVNMFHDVLTIEFQASNGSYNVAPTYKAYKGDEEVLIYFNNDGIPNIQISKQMPLNETYKVQAIYTMYNSEVIIEHTFNVVINAVPPNIRDVSPTEGFIYSYAEAAGYGGMMFSVSYTSWVPTHTILVEWYLDDVMIGNEKELRHDVPVGTHSVYVKVTDTTINVFSQSDTITFITNP